ncbi:hypothetical protein FOL47_001608, partial [Perkinsus chesapeaki]
TRSLIEDKVVLCDSKAHQESGYFRTHHKLFFWYFVARSFLKKAPTLIHIQGDPGASTMYSVVSGNGGPCLLGEDGMSTTLNMYSYNSFANVLYIDAPGTVGYTQIDHKYAVTVPFMLLHALQEFFKTYRYNDTDAFLVGQSYAGEIGSFSKLLSLRVFNAGYYVAEDVPEAALQMMRDFVKNELH